jgi:metal-responsive CopG/Arc/MetJ family transcriptional regulator
VFILGSYYSRSDHVGAVVKIAISLPEELLAAAERERLARGESRSQFFRLAMEAYLREAQRRAAVAEYVESYRQHPETAEEIAAVSVLSELGFSQEPWD